MKATAGKDCLGRVENKAASVEALTFLSRRSTGESCCFAHIYEYSFSYCEMQSIFYPTTIPTHAISKPACRRARVKRNSARRNIFLPWMVMARLDAAAVALDVGHVSHPVAAVPPRPRGTSRPFGPAGIGDACSDGGAFMPVSEGDRKPEGGQKFHLPSGGGTLVSRPFFSRDPHH